MNQFFKHILLFVQTLLIVSLSFSQQTSNETSPLIFKDGEAQVVPAFSDKRTWIKEELWVETTFDSDFDGKLDRMHVFVTRPSQTQSGKIKLPIIYMSSPYYGLTFFDLAISDHKKSYWKVKHELGSTPKPHRHSKLSTRADRPIFSWFEDNTWVPRGYITVYSSSPGTGLSDGAPTIGGENESLAPKAVIDWLCGRAKGFKTRTGNEEVSAFWSSGKVGMTGTSYDGTLCIAAATTGVEGLKAIIPIAPVTSFYNYYRSNGLVRSPEGYLGEDMDVLYDVINTGDETRRSVNNQRVRDSILVKNQDRITGDFNEFWASRDYLSKIDNMNAAMIMAHGFNDWNVMPEQSYRFYKAAKEKGLPVQLYYHQGAHGGEPPFTMMNRWFTHYLHEVENNVEKDISVRIVRENEDYPRSYESFPDPSAQNVTFYLQGGNVNNGILTTKSLNPQPIDTLNDNRKIEGKLLVESKHAKHRLLYVTPKLQNSLRISGIPTIKLRLGSNKPAANLSVWLVSLSYDFEKQTYVFKEIINRGWADPQNHKSLSYGEPLKVGSFYDVSFDLNPDDQIIPTGTYIGLMVFSSDSEFTLLPKPGTELYIDQQNSTITIPILGEGHFSAQ